MRRELFIIISLIVFMLIASCDNNFTNLSNGITDNGIVIDDIETAKQVYLQSKENGTKRIQTYDQDLAELTLDVDGFGGHFMDEDGFLTIYLLDENQKEDIQSIINQRVDSNSPGFDEDILSNIKIKKGNFNFIQLYNWKQTLRTEILGRDEVLSLSINERKNNLSIGVKSLDSKDKILQITHELGIPGLGTDIVLESPMTPLINNERSDLAGGLQISYSTGSSVFNCTLGPTARINSQISGFLVNSHCSENQFSVDGQEYYQANMNDRHIATELYDPPGFTGGVCPPGFTCAYADAAFAQWTGNGNYEFGMIHETEYWDSVSGSTNSLGANLEIISAQPQRLPVLTTDNKIGITTGWTFGQALDICKDFSVGGVIYLCQVEVNLGAWQGDSGSPVFYKNQLIPYDVGLRGILWGGNGTNAAYSPVDQISNHFGHSFDYY